MTHGNERWPLSSSRELTSEESRAAWRYALIVMVPIILLVAPFWVTDVDPSLLGTFTPFAMWLPTLAAILAARSLSSGQPLRRILAVTPLRPVRPIVVTMLATFVGFSVLALTTLALSQLFGFLTIDLVNYSGFRASDPTLTVAQAQGQVIQTILLLPLFALAYMVLTTGEELGWRGFLLSTLRPWGFWRSGTAIGILWAIWHVPLTATYAHLDIATWSEAIATTVNLVLAGYVLCGLRWLTDSVWPAVFGHAVLNTVLVFFYSTLPNPLYLQEPAAWWGFTVTGWLVWCGAILVIHRLLVRQQSQHQPNRRLRPSSARSRS